MEFMTFCRSLGIIINTPPPIGIWRRYPTVDHPRSRNGAVKFMGDVGFAQNHATDTDVSVWSDASATISEKKNYQELADKAEMERLRMQNEAVKKSASILKECKIGRHSYLKSKGFPEEEGNIFLRDGEQILIIPMRVDGHLVGLQLINEEGKKKFLYGQRTSNAEFVFDNKGTHIFCEGYATALSIRKAMKNLKRRYTLHVCFSAGNMLKIASAIGEGIVIADNDASATGEKTAKQIGLPYWMSDTVGEDFNDFHARAGIFQAAQSLRRVIDASAIAVPSRV
jgi:putative DNA primase/helicase